MAVGIEQIRGQVCPIQIELESATIGMPGPEEARHTRDTAFGPPSDPINLLEFLRMARTAKRDVLDRIDTEWQAISDEDEQRVQKELT